MRKGLPYDPPQRAEQVTDANHLAEEAAEVSVGDRCEVRPGGKRGTVRWVAGMLLAHCLQGLPAPRCKLWQQQHC